MKRLFLAVTLLVSTNTVVYASMLTRQGGTSIRHTVIDRAAIAQTALPVRSRQPTGRREYLVDSRTEGIRAFVTFEHIDVRRNDFLVAPNGVRTFGCSTKWPEKVLFREAPEATIETTTVRLEKSDAGGLKKLRQPTGHVTIINFWATWSGSCVAEFSNLEDTFRMYNDRDLELVTVSANMPDEQPAMIRFLQKKYATARNYLFACDDTATLQAAFDPKWQSAGPYAVVFGRKGDVIYKTLGSVDLLKDAHQDPCSNAVRVHRL